MSLFSLRGLWESPQSQVPWYECCLLQRVCGGGRAEHPKDSPYQTSFTPKACHDGWYMQRWLTPHHFARCPLAHVRNSFVCAMLKIWMVCQSCLAYHYSCSGQYLSLQFSAENNHLFLLIQDANPYVKLSPKFLSIFPSRDSSKFGLDISVSPEVPTRRSKCFQFFLSDVFRMSSPA